MKQAIESLLVAEEAARQAAVVRDRVLNEHREAQERLTAANKEAAELKELRRARKQKEKEAKRGKAAPEGQGQPAPPSPSKRKRGEEGTAGVDQELLLGQGTGS